MCLTKTLSNHIKKRPRRKRRRNIKIHSESLKSSAYKVLVRPQLEYYPTVWCPFTDGSNMTMDRLPVSQK